MEQVLSTAVLQRAESRNLTSSTSTPLVLPAKRKHEHSNEREHIEKNEKAPKSKKQRKQERAELKKNKLSRAQKKRLERSQAKKVKQEKRQQLLLSLSQNALDPEKMKLLHATTTLGQKATLKENLRRAFIEKQTIGYSITEAPLERIVEPQPSSPTRQLALLNQPPQHSAIVIPALVQNTTKNPDIPKPAIQHSPPKPHPVSSSKTPKESRPATNIPVTRTTEIQQQRSQLPIFMEEQRIMEAISEQDVVVICGETGSGKTTQVPQFLYEAGFGASDLGKGGMIGITQPRRVAAVSMATRVAEEMNVALGSVVAYQIRYDSSVSHQSVIKFMTDGILLKEIQSDFLLRRYSAIIIDEAHERNLNTDILIGLLSRIVPLRRKMNEEAQGSTTRLSPLKLIIMSATLRVDDFAANPGLFPIPPLVLSVDARQYPVTVHFNRRTPVDYVDEALHKVLKIHTRLPSGGILVFLSGQQEIERLCKDLRNWSPPAPTRRTLKSANKHTEDSKEEPDKQHEAKEEETEEQVVGPLHILPLYSALPTKQQLRVFETPPEGSRLVVVATNVAETSLTIPNIKYVIDTGKVKEKRFDRTSGVSSYHITWTSVASANQRAGRAGRTGPGHAYRLYSSAVFNDHFEKFSEPEINRIPIEGVVLQMKSMSIEKIMSFPFPTPPDHVALSEAVKLLRSLGALDDAERITPLGRTISSLPLAPRLAKMLVLGRQGGCLPYILSIVASLSVEEPLLRVPQYFGSSNDSLQAEPDDEEEKRRLSQRILARHAPWKHAQSDLLTNLRAIGAATFAGCNPGQLEKFCTSHYLNEKALKEILSLREQLAFMIQDAYGEESSLDGLSPPSTEQEILLRQIVAAGLVDQVARQQELGREGGAGIMYQLSRGSEGWIHPSSSVAGSPPEWLVYTSVIATSKPYMRGITAIHPGWLLELSPSLCDFGVPLESPAPRYDSDAIRCWVHARYGPQSWELGLHEIEMPPNILRYKYFMRFLLEGKIFASLVALREHLTGKPSTVTSSTQSSHKTMALLLALSNNDVYSKETFLHVWRKQKDFLLAEMKLWVRTNGWATLEELWEKLA